MTCARRRPGEPVGVSDRLARRLGHDHRTGTRHTRDAARNINGATEPIARAAYRRSGGNADAQLREALCIRGCNQSQSGIQQRHRIGAYKHHRVPNRLDEPNGSDGDVAGKILQSAGELFQFLGRHRLTKAGESDEVSECTAT